MLRLRIGRHCTLSDASLLTMPGLISCKDTGHWTCWDHGAGPPTHQKEKKYLPIFAKGQFRHPSSGPQSWTHQVQTARLPALVKPVREILCIFCWYRFVDSHGKSMKILCHHTNPMPSFPLNLIKIPLIHIEKTHAIPCHPSHSLQNRTTCHAALQIRHFFSRPWCEKAASFQYFNRETDS